MISLCKIPNKTMFFSVVNQCIDVVTLHLPDGKSLVIKDESSINDQIDYLNLHNCLVNISVKNSSDFSLMVRYMSEMYI